MTNCRRRILRICRSMGKAVSVATNMLEAVKVMYTVSLRTVTFQNSRAHIKGSIILNSRSARQRFLSNYEKLVSNPKTEDSVKCEVVDGGEPKSRRHLNVRGKVQRCLPSLVET
ncbi:hypothetical protein EZV62_006013 [Acer yangbiense]|uniref:Uncharacterized protein n=1 Tax=Acer yangbiense TaxID=1000413 RepID=A0A5C7IPS2_9ROSI|nr:hypothetical protein EZV62_006013 [Acer yangbiense]